jgi:integrase
VHAVVVAYGHGMPAVEGAEDAFGVGSVGQRIEDADGVGFVGQLGDVGLRKGEVVGLPWSAMNLDQAELDIGWQLQRVRGQLLHRETKTEASEATLPMPGICVTALRIREKDQAAARAAAGASWEQSGLVFTTRVGTPFEPRNLNRRFETRCAKAGVRRITCTT